MEPINKPYFYRDETSYQVESKQIKWQFTQLSENTEQFLPLMKTDITIKAPNWKLIIDTKYYKEAFKLSYDQPKFDSGNLYQLFAYLINQEDGTAYTKTCQGMLLYPSTKDYPDAEMWYQDHKIKICFLNLNQDWWLIKNNLMTLIC